MLSASVTYEILMYLNSFYFGMFAICEISIIVLKAINLHYPENTFLKEILLLIALFLMELVRMILGKKCSLNDKGWQVGISAVLILPCICGIVYFLAFQRYMLKLEYILCALLIALEGAEFLFAIIFIFTICKSNPYI